MCFLFVHSEQVMMLGWWRMRGRQADVPCLVASLQLVIGLQRLALARKEQMSIRQFKKHNPLLCDASSSMQYDQIVNLQCINQQSSKRTPDDTEQ
ncbi:uncharacterized protein TNIN_67301 [Trichonephila inaurata madagascariensis]|uniref:Uncharacterized protein n=1 Tax=Trichonephila inaurata madagascariensis TaxID=2747483 RepID=A0A8X6JTK6_9ARAC|nr:uncharacterized protein TNIN_67301 [Trichonephila inaurata madagascariensis]